MSWEFNCRRGGMENIMSNERETRLQEINQTLSARNLKPLAKLGDATKSEIEALRILEIHDHSAKFFTDVKFEVKFPNGAIGAYAIRFNANGIASDGNVMVVLVNGRFAVVKQWRLPLGRWTYEMPRGFGEKLDQAKASGQTPADVKVKDLPLATLVRELGDDIMSGAQVTSITHLGDIAENSGTNAVEPSYFLVQIKVDEDKLKGKLVGNEDGMVVKLWDTATLEQEIGNKLRDNHTLTAITLATKHLKSLPRE